MHILYRELSVHSVSHELSRPKCLFIYFVLTFGAQELASLPSISSGRVRPTRLILRAHPQPPPYTLPV